MRNDWTIETNWGGCMAAASAISKINHTTGATKIQNSTQKIMVETLKNNSAIEIDQGGHRVK